MIIYVSQADGRIDRTFLPLIEGTLDGPDAIFGLIYRHLRFLGIGEADQLLFIADGARWIWERVELLKKLLSLTNVSFDPLEIVDFYHAVQHLHEFAKTKRGWGKKKRTRWLNTQKRALKNGKIDEVITTMRKAAKSKILWREIRYFTKNRHRFKYDLARSLGFPIGSGAIESAIRRVVNLRMKSPCCYWKEDTAMEMLFLRSYYKAGRWEEVKSLSYQGKLQEAA